MNDFDVIVIGGGTEGLAAARAAREMGATVAIVEQNHPGGEALQTGRIPFGALLKTARTFNQCRESMEFGIRSENARVVWNAVKLRIADVRDDIRTLWREELKTLGIELISGTARFEDAQTLHVTGKNGERIVRAAQSIVAAGSTPGEPKIEGLTETGFITPAQLLNLPELPRSLALLGNGPRAVETAFAFARLGCKVTVLHRAGTLLPGEDSEISAFAEKLLQQEGVTLHAGAYIHRAQTEGEKKQVVFESGSETHCLDSRHILPISECEVDLASLNPEAAGIRWSARGVQTDEYLQAAPNVWACGGATGEKSPAPGALAARNALSPTPQSVSETASARIVFTDPAMAAIGLSEGQAREKWNDVQIFRQKFSQLERAVIEGETRGFVKLVAGQGGRILGAHIAGQNAGELLAPLVAAMQPGKAAPGQEPITPVYPTWNEGVQRVLAQYSRTLGVR